jgi:hypothetical protein
LPFAITILYKNDQSKYSIKTTGYINNPKWNQGPIANSLDLSQLEVSEFVARSKYAKLLDPKGKTVIKMALIEFPQYGVRYVFPHKNLEL